MRTFAALLTLLTASSAWQWPIAGSDALPVVVRPFAPPTLRWESGHRGVDLAASQPAATVFAAGAGTVTFAGPVVGRPVVVVAHGTVRTSYEPVLPTVTVGTVVSRGQPIGTLQPGHCPAAPCLHWGLLSGYGHAVRYYDPLLLVGPVHVRLEPLDPSAPDSG